MIKIVLINGKARVGKDTLASFLCNEFKRLGYENVYVRGNAQTVKDYATKYFQWEGNKDDKGRKLLINLTNMMYAIEENFWERKTLDYIKDLYSEEVYESHLEGSDKDVDLICIIPDWRYLETYTYLKRVAKHDHNLDVYTIHLDRVGFENNLSKELKDDISESDLLKDLAEIKILKRTSDLNGFTAIAKQVVTRII